jgi:hypothetical protein
MGTGGFRSGVAGVTRAKVKKGLASKCAGGSLEQPKFNAISQALAIPGNTPKAEVAKTYRNRLMHHVRPSVDYSQFFSALESGTGEEVRDAQEESSGNAVSGTAGRIPLPGFARRIYLESVAQISYCFPKEAMVLFIWETNRK